VALDSHINESDLIRDSIREKIQRDAPQLYSKLLAEAMEKGQKQREKKPLVIQEVSQHGPDPEREEET